MNKKAGIAGEEEKEKKKKKEDRGRTDPVDFRNSEHGYAYACCVQVQSTLSRLAFHQRPCPGDRFVRATLNGCTYTKWHQRSTTGASECTFRSLQSITFVLILPNLNKATHRLKSHGCT